jgi:hypothetical protein
MAKPVKCKVMGYDYYLSKDIFITDKTESIDTIDTDLASTSAGNTPKTFVSISEAKRYIVQLERKPDARHKNYRVEKII